MAFKLSFNLPPWLVRVLDSPRLAARFQPDLPQVAVEVGSQALVAVALKRDRECGRARRAAGNLLDSACGLAAGSLLVRLLETNPRAREALPWWYLTASRRRYSQPGFKPSRTA